MSHDINSDASAFVDWNMLLDFHGGLTYCNNNLKAPIILNEKGDDFIVTPIYNALKKFAELFPAGSEVMRCEYSSKDFVAIARKTKNGCEVVVANLSNEPQGLSIKHNDKEKTFSIAKNTIKSFSV